MPLPKSSVLIPLYVYPLTPETWSPLYDAIARYPHLPFTIIINPNSGPGSGHDPRPDPRYTQEIAKLNTFPNVTLVGYVRIEYCKRDLDKVLREITHYGQWAGLRADGSEDPSHVPEIVVSSDANDSEEGGHQNGHARPPVKQKPSFLKALRDKSPFRSRSKSPSAPAAGAAHLSSGHQNGSNAGSARGRDDKQPRNTDGNHPNGSQRRPLSMQGIFFDETPNIHDPKKREFLRTITHAAKSTPGIGGKQLVLHNPGTMPDAQLVDPTLPFSDTNTTRTQGSALVVPDVTAVFEASHAEYLSPSPWMKEQMSKCKLDRTRQAYFVHSVPVDRVQELTMRLRSVAGHIYISDLTEGFYCTFDESFPKFVEGMAFAG